MNDFAKILGTQIKIIRIKKGVSQQDVAARADITPSYMSRIESGSITTSVEKLYKIAQAIGCGPADLLPEYTFIYDD